MLSSIQNSFFTKPLIAVLIVALFNLSFIPNGNVLLKAGTQLQLELVNMIDTEMITSGQTIDFRVKFDVKADGKVVIAAGSIAKGQVIRAEKAKALGKAGQVQIEIKSVTAVDGSHVYLSGGNVFREGEDKQTLSIVLGLFVCILFLLKKGENVQIASGTSFDVQVATNAEIKVD